MEAEHGRSFPEIYDADGAKRLTNENTKFRNFRDDCMEQND